MLYLPTNPSFQKTQGFVTGITNFHKLDVTILKSYSKKHPLNNISYRKNKVSDKTYFHRDLGNRFIPGKLYNNCVDPYYEIV